jgi:hypothetical protein
MTHAFIDDECNECMLYVKHLATTEQWTCHYCQLSEQSYNGIIWERYKLACGHQVHIRCYRIWCKQIDKVGCKSCGILEKIEENKHCYYCKAFGHDTSHCPIVRYLQTKEYVIALWNNWYGAYCGRCV